MIGGPPPARLRGVTAILREPSRWAHAPIPASSLQAIQALVRDYHAVILEKTRWLLSWSPTYYQACALFVAGWTSIMAGSR